MASRKPAQSHDGSTGTVAAPPASTAAVAPIAATSTRPSSPMHAVDQHHGGRQRLGLRRPGRVADADHVAADVARQEVVEEGRHQVGATGGGARRTLTRCGSSSTPQRQAADQHLDQVEAERRQRPTGATRFARSATGWPGRCARTGQASRPRLTSSLRAVRRSWRVRARAVWNPVSASAVRASESIVRRLYPGNCRGTPNVERERISLP